MRKVALLAMAVILAGALWGCAEGEEADETSPVIYGISASSVTEISAIIDWTTNEPATSQVEYGLTTSYGSTTNLDENLVASHSVSLSGLTASTTYHYRVKSKDSSGNQAVSEDRTFSTTSVPNQPPNQPSNVSPTDGATDVGLTTTLTCSAFSDPDAGDTHAASQWQITTTSGDYSSPVFDSSTDATNLASIITPLGTLDNATTYYWRVRHQDDHNAWSSYSSETSFNTVIFPDENLEAAVREAINKPEGAIHIADLESLDFLDASERDITDIAGLEYCVNLTTLDLNDNEISDISLLPNVTSLRDLALGRNQISDITPLSTLTELTDLNLTGNHISDISSLSSLVSLTTLSLYYNQISDISPLSNLTSLTYLGLDTNEVVDISALGSLTNLEVLSLAYAQIIDVSPLSDLAKLTRLYLHGNQIIDITPLANNAGLAEGDEVYLQGNPLSAESINTLIPQLEARGVEVLYDAP